MKRGTSPIQAAHHRSYLGNASTSKAPDKRDASNNNSKLNNFVFNPIDPFN
jgi:hypothetical protein